jgi:hypothetical protein
MSSLQWGDVPTWAGNGRVAFGALIGASLTYRAQSAQVRLQRQQLADQQEATQLRGSR